MAAEPVNYFTLKLNYLQFKTVRNLFNHSGWDFEDCLVGTNKSFDTNINNENVQQENEISEPPNEQTGGSHDGSDDGDDDDNDGDDFGNNINQNGECENTAF